MVKKQKISKLKRYGNFVKQYFTKTLRSGAFENVFSFFVKFVFAVLEMYRLIFCQRCKKKSFAKCYI